MKAGLVFKIILATILGLSGSLVAQVAPINFEAEGIGADWTWTSFENDTNPPLTIVSNPGADTVNASAMVASYTTLTTGQPWAGFESLHGADIGPFSFDVTNSTIKLMVYKTVISDVGVKFAEANGEAQPEVKVANTLINQWEELTFDLSGSIGAGITGIVDQIIIFPDFDLVGRTTDNTCYIDNITFSGQDLPPAPAAHAPLPTAPADDVISVFSDSYTNLAQTNFNPGWGQETVMSEVMIEGNNTLLYSSLDYQGIELGSAQDLTEMDSVHVDFWSANSTELQIFLISQSSGEQAYSLPFATETWVSTYVPLSHFTDLGLSISDIFQLKFVGNGDVYIDNIYFEGEGGGLEPTPYFPIDFEIDGHGADWTWTTFENGANDPLVIGTNPSTTGVNASATVASMTTMTTGAAWAGVESQHGADIGTFSLDASNSTISIMVYKPILSDVGIKLAKPDGWSMGEIKVANSVINEWEELTFDFSSQMQDGYDQIVIFPDFDLAGRTTDNTCYFDNITFSGQVVPASPVAHAPIPTLAAEDVVSIFSDSYPSTAGVNLNPGWGQATVVSEVEIEQNNTLVYSDLNYQGTEFQAIDVSGMTHFHLDFWTGNSTALNFFVISQTPTVDSDYFTLAITPEQWISLDIPLTAYPNVDLADVFQFKVEGNGTIYWDNFYFYSNTVAVDDERKEVIPSEFILEQNFPNPFNPGTSVNYRIAESGSVTLKIYNILGQEVVTLVDGFASPGYYSTHLDANHLAAGTYFYALTSGNQRIVKKMVLIK